MIISLIAALDQAGGIGKDGQIPWRLSSDLKWFKRITMGHALIMGRKTFESIASPLPGRINLLLSKQEDFQPQGIHVFQSLGEALSFARGQGEQEVFIIGGGEVFQQSIDLAERLYLTRVHAEFDCDVFFPEFDLDEWRVIEEEIYPSGEKDQVPFTFQILEKEK
jgi:dihydrofolate reductase